MFYRRKLILAVLQIFGGRVEKIYLQKFLFIVCGRQIKPEYEFIPYLYGCYSHSAKADLATMVSREIIKEDNAAYTKSDTKDYVSELKDADRKILKQAFVQFNKMSSEGIMKHTYTYYPYYSINSVKAEELLNGEQLAAVNAARPVAVSMQLFTIGYEGISLEAYLNKLIKNDIRVLVDVRNNPLSQKFGFSKSQLKKYCDGINIEYIHMPEVGIESQYRKELNSQKDYDRLFTNYKKTTLLKSKKSQEEILALLKERKRIALTCFEADICQCHRKPLAEAIQSLPGFSYEVKHI